MTPAFNNFLITADLPVLQARFDNLANPKEMPLSHMLKPGGLFGSVIYEMDIICFGMIGKRLGRIDYVKDVSSADFLKPILHDSPLQVISSIQEHLFTGMLSVALENVLDITEGDEQTPKAVSIKTDWNPVGVHLGDYDNGAAIPLPSQDLILSEKIRPLIRKCEQPATQPTTSLKLD